MFLSQSEINMMLGPKAPANGSRSEKRGACRHAFPASIWSLPMTGKLQDILPTFYPTRFRDLSTAGVSFYWPKEPDFNKLLILMSGQGLVITALAEVVRSTKVARKADDECLVGCRLVRLSRRARYRSGMALGIGKAPGLRPGGPLFAERKAKPQATGDLQPPGIQDLLCHLLLVKKLITSPITTIRIAQRAS